MGVRAAIPLLAVVLGVTAMSVRSSADRGPLRPARPASLPPVAELPPVPPAPVSLPAAPPPARKPIPAPEPQERNRPVLATLLERELALSPDQRRHVENVLARREGEIELYHRQLRALGAVSGDAYHRHMQELRALSYTQIGMALDTAQHRRFLELVATGALNDLIAMEVEEGMVELD